MWFPHIAIDLVFVLDVVILYFFALRFKWYAIVCKSSSDVAIKIWSSVYSIVFTNFLLFSCIPFFITILNSCIILLMYILNNTGERPYPCHSFVYVYWFRYTIIKFNHISVICMKSWYRRSVL